ncbi:MAG: STAS/SEC14 domain-containing protein [Leeuwenhoekiella sp.]
MRTNSQIEEFKFADNVFGFMIHKQLCERVYDDLQERMLRAIKQSKRINIYLEDLSGKPPKFKVLNRDFKFKLSHQDSFDRVAIVTHNRSLINYAKLKDHFMAAEIKTFRSQQRVEALSWISEVPSHRH